MFPTVFAEEASGDVTSSPSQPLDVYSVLAIIFLSLVGLVIIVRFAMHWLECSVGLERRQVGGVAVEKPCNAA